MTRVPASGTLALPLAVAASVLVLVVGAAQASPPRPARVELEVAGLLPMAEGTSSILVLREKGAKTIVPVLVSGAAARDLSRTIAEHKRHGVLADAIEKLGGRVREVEIAEAEETPDGALIRLAQGGRQLEVAARPSESVALAVAAGVPIVTTRKVMEQSGLSPDDLVKARDRIADGSHGLRL
ncbi:bifunctional nuclease family protein [Anaeromyxobacter oryzae]|uniref:BFN domain-containing protein n=1 Tax=Anaeromyxobacter oryzae TaxID=2918170 RepID=A0ABN6MZV8_9BACT|nr:bifunctional nuclease domain-containing protein [Anaeromyxobacter oryzae]BDG06476.1 hypothetical protein AMOR_54720 [Anaeromyxobacter oryzae]